MRPLTFETKLLRIVLQQGVRRFPINLRPLLGIDRGHSSKGMGFLARGFLRLHQATGDPQWAEKSEALPPVANRPPIARLLGGLLGQSFRLPVTQWLHS